MSKPAAANEWDQLVCKIGKLAIVTGYLEAAIIAMVCRITGKLEDELEIYSNEIWCRKLEEVRPASWSESERKDLSKRIKKIRSLYGQRSKLMHTALGTVSDGSISGVPPGSIIDMRTYGLGYTKKKGNTWTIGTVAKRVHLKEIDKLTEAIHQARLGLVPYMDLADQVKHSSNPVNVGELMRKAKRGELISTSARRSPKKG